MLLLRLRNLNGGGNVKLNVYITFRCVMFVCISFVRFQNNGSIRNIIAQGDLLGS